MLNQPKINDSFGMWTVIGPKINRRTKTGSVAYCKCRCECGLEKDVRIQHLRDNNSSGCHRCRNGMRKHGHTISVDGVLTTTVEYRAWCAMRQRCENKNGPAFRDYGARGISVFPQWQDKNTGFQSFYAFVFNNLGLRPSTKHSLDRINNNGNYEPGNIRWATEAEQKANTRRSLPVEIGGVVRPLYVWADILGVSRRTVAARRKRGLPLLQCLRVR